MIRRYSQCIGMINNLLPTPKGRSLNMTRGGFRPPLREHEHFGFLWAFNHVAMLNLFCCCVIFLSLVLKNKL